MTRTLQTVVLLGLLLAAPLAIGQDGSDPGNEAGAVNVLEDPAGDAQASVNSQEQTLDPTWRPSIDLIGLDIQETGLMLELVLRVASFDDLAPEADFGRNYQVTFEHGGRRYGVAYFDGHGASGTFTGAALYAVESSGTSWIMGLDAERSDAEGSLTARVPRDAVPTKDGAPAVLGNALTNVSAVSMMLINQRQPINAGPAELGPTWIGDRMPDAGVGEYDVRLGLEQTGHIRLASDLPYRTSNGEASTFIFMVRATNSGSETDQFAVKVKGAPEGWDVRGPSERVTIAGKESIEFPVTVRTQFAHEHGAARSFVLELHSLTDSAAVGRVELGIRYPAVPQPGGHHSQLVLHSLDLAENNPLVAAFGIGFGLAFGGSDSSKVAFMNTDSEAPDDDQVPVDGQRCGLGLGGTVVLNVTYCWDIRLSPALDLGLDFDMDRLGTIQVPISALVPAQGATVSGYFHVLAPPEGEFMFDRESTVVAHILPTDSIAIGPAGNALLEGTVAPAPGGDYVPFVEGSDLVLRLNVTLDRPDNVYLGPGDPPKLLPGGWMELPLIDYEDRDPQTFGIGGLIRLEATSPQQRLANPGAVVLYNLTLHNDGPVEDAFSLNVAGSHEQWATITTGRAVTLEAGEKKRLVVSVSVPEDALDGERADLILQALSASDPNQRALVRLVTTVDTETEHRNDAGLVPQSEKNTPLVPVALLIAGLLAMARRRP